MSTPHATTQHPAPHSAARATTQDTENTTMATSIAPISTTAPATTSNATPSTPRNSAGGGTVLTSAYKQWANRPADERFGSLEALHEACAHHRDVAVEARGVDLRTLDVRVDATRDEDGETYTYPILVGANGNEAHFTHYGFSQLSRRIGAPSGYLRSLPPELAADNMRHGLRTADNADGHALLFAKNGNMRLRACLTDSYTRIWNADITSRLLRLVDQQPQWQPAPAAFDGSRGLYASDADMFAFLVDNDRRIFETDEHGGLGRGFFVENSEVGAGAFKVTTFFYEYVCGNHRVWGASGVAELSIRHVGNADERAFDEMSVELRKYADASAADDEAKVVKMRAKMLGKDKDETLDAIFGLRHTGVTLKLLEQSYDVAEAHEDWYGAPTSVWGLTGGMTQVARDLANASDRVAMERAAGKIMQMAF